MVKEIKGGTKMKKISKAVALILTLALMLTILAACGGGTTTQSQAP